MLTKDQAIKLLHDSYPYLSAEYGVLKIGLFGSYAKGQPTETSDVDVVVEFARPIGLRFIELSEYLETLFGKKVDLLTPTGIREIRVASVARNIEESLLYV